MELTRLCMLLAAPEHRELLNGLVAMEWRG